MSSSTQLIGRRDFVVPETPRRAALPAVAVQPKPTLVFFYSPKSGSSRRTEGFLAQVLQRRRNHHTFTVRRLDYDEHAELADRLGVQRSPALVVVEAKRVRARLEQPRGCADITTTLAPWLT